MLEYIFVTVINMSITASIAALVVILLRAVTSKILPKKFSYAIWAVVLLRLLVPFSFSSALSLFNAIPVSNETVAYTGSVGTISYVPSREIETVSEPSDTFSNSGRVINNEEIPASDTTGGETFEFTEIIYFSVKLLWLAGAILMISYSIFSYIKVAKKLRTAVLAEDYTYLEECRKILKIKRRIKCFSSEVIDTPAVFGLINPRIILPANLSFQSEEATDRAEGLFTASFRKCILTHELVHIKRFDYLIKPLSLLILCVHWFNPVIWLSYRLFQKDMEMSCDERVINVCEEDIRKLYASSLINMAATQNRIFSNGLLAFGESNVKARVRGIMNYRRPAFWVGIVLVMIITAASLVLLTNPSSSRETFAVADNPGEVSDSGTSNTNLLSVVDTGGKLLLEPLELSKTEIVQNGKAFTVKLLMTEGSHITDGDIGPYGTEYYQGNLIGEVYDSEGKLLAANDLTADFTEKLIFRDKFDLLSDDYNADGLSEFTVGQYLGSNYHVYNIFTLGDNGQIRKLPVENNPDGIMCSDFDGYYSTRFKKATENGIKCAVYDIEKGEYIEKSYRWAEGKFVEVTGNKSDVRVSFPEDNEKITLKDGSSINSSELTGRLDMSDDTIRYVYKNSQDDIRIRIGTIYEGSFSGSGEKELLAIFKFSGVPHAGGLDYTVAAIYEKNGLKRISQKAFMSDEVQLVLLNDSKGKNYLLVSGTKTYQGHSTCGLELLSLSNNWKEMLPKDSGINSDGRLRFNLQQDGIVSVLEPQFSDNDVVGWSKRFYLKWNSKTAVLEDYIPDTYEDKTAKKYFDGASVSPDGRYAAVSHKWGFDNNSYVLIYDIKKNKLTKKYDILAQDFAYSWSPDSKKLCVTRLARVWVDTAIIDVGKKTLVSMMDNGIAGFNQFKKLGISFNYQLQEYRPDPYLEFCQWSPDCNKVLMFYQWTDSDHIRQNGNFVYSLDDKSVSRITQNKPDIEHDNLEPVAPKGFKW